MGRQATASSIASHEGSTSKWDSKPKMKDAACQREPEDVIEILLRSDKPIYSGINAKPLDCDKAVRAFACVVV